MKENFQSAASKLNASIININAKRFGLKPYMYIKNYVSKHYGDLNLSEQIVLSVDLTEHFNYRFD